MRPNLDTLKTQIQGYLEAEGLVIFHGHSRTMDSPSLVFWDTEKYPDFKLFVKAAQAAGVKMLILNQRDFSADVIDDAIDQMAASDLPSEDQRTIERRLKDLRAYEGFTCTVELSFDHQGRIYMFDVQTEWYEELSGLLDDLEFLDKPDQEQDDERDAMGGYFSRN